MTDHQADAAAVAFAKIVGSVALLVASTVVDAWLLSLLWRWFMIPLGAPVLTFWQIAGVACVFRAFVPFTEPPRKNAPDVDWWSLWTRALITRPLVTLVFAGFINWMLP